eukprot:m.335837 g.335837  ORF g.335837 m.335837 type:complete len:600 (-) comp17689_c0_seq1:79-1878(-)
MMLAWCLLLLAELKIATACTTIIVGRNATNTGAVLAAHSDDGFSNGDARILLHPAQVQTEKMRPVYFDQEDFPHGPTPSMTPIGYIPQVNFTYGYFSNTYGIINEYQVGMAESTCSAVFGAKPAGKYGGKALLSIDTLSRIGLERCKTARCAVQTMGSLAVKYGFFGAGSFEGSAESLMVIDSQEGWIFHILPDNTGTSAIWAAQRVPDDHIGIVANMFTIREVDLTKPNEFLGSSNMHDIAQNVLKNWKPEDGLLDFTKVFSDGEYAHKYYSGRRMWGGYKILAPTVTLPAEYGDLKFDQVYPTTVAPENVVSRDDLFKVYRSYYENTDYDMTQGMAAGPWGNPTRFNGGSGKVHGNWERSIGIYRTTHTHIVEARAWLPNALGGMVWYSPHTASASCFVPFPCGMVSLPEVYTETNPNILDKVSAYWAHRYVFNIMQIKFSHMSQYVMNMSVSLEKNSSDLVASMDSLVTSSNQMPNITTVFTDNANAIVEKFWSLPDQLIMLYADGFYNDSYSISYPDEWINGTNYVSGPPQAPCPPCPCTPITSPQCSSCCKGEEKMTGKETPSICVFRECVTRCSQHEDDLKYRSCIAKCDANC